VCNEKTKCVADVCIDGKVRLSFRRKFFKKMLNSWDELVAIVEKVILGGVGGSLT
jgi:hypothetical protein